MFVPTGTLEGYVRDEAKTTITRLGGRVTSSVSRKTNYVIVVKDPGLNYYDTRGLGILVFDEVAFRDLIGVE